MDTVIELSESAFTSHQFTVLEHDAGMRLDRAVAHYIPSLSRTQAQTLIQTNRVRNTQGSITDCAYRVKPGEDYQVFVPTPEAMELKPADIPINIVFEDEHMLVIDKSAGMAVHPGDDFRQNTLTNALIHHCGIANLSTASGVLRRGIVHRLDKDTTGLMVAAKHNDAHQHLAEQIKERTLKRCYQAVIWGVPMAMSGTITGNIDRSPANRKKMAVVKEGGRDAITHYKVKEIFGNGIASLVECRLETGRTHQIRVHFTYNAHPVVGDQLYGTTKRKVLSSLLPEVRTIVEGFKRQALHSCEIAFTHPVTGQPMEFSSPVPGDMAELIEALRKSEIGSQKSVGTKPLSDF